MMRQSSEHDICPICMDSKKFAVETNCGHVYCSRCIVQNWRVNFRMSAMSCPFCRQEVTMLLPCFTEEEQHPTEAAHQREKEQLVHDVKEFNRLYSDQPRSIWCHLQDLPIILRHIWGELFTWRGVEFVSRMRVMVGVVIAVAYAITPIDIIPEAFFGLLGLIDDLVVVAFVLIQVGIVYRTLVADREW